jgi:hypothetical protein
MHCFPQLVVTEAMVGIEVEANRVRENNLCAPCTFGTRVQAQGKQGGNQVHVGARQAIQRPLQATATRHRCIRVGARHGYMTHRILGYGHDCGSQDLQWQRLDVHAINQHLSSLVVGEAQQGSHEGRLPRTTSPDDAYPLAPTNRKPAMPITSRNHQQAINTSFARTHSAEQCQHYSRQICGALRPRTRFRAAHSRMASCMQDAGS